MPAPPGPSFPSRAPALPPPRCPPALPAAHYLPSFSNTARVSASVSGRIAARLTRAAAPEAEVEVPAPEVPVPEPEVAWARAGGATAMAAEEERLLAWLRGPAAAGPGGAELAAYVAELAALGLAELGREPARLAAERERVGAETRRLAFEHYRAFIRSAECTGRAGRGFGGIESRLGSLLERLPALQDACR